MRILHIINSTTPAGGGPIESIVQAHKVLRPQGHEFEIACMDPPTAPWLGDLPVPTHALGPATTKYRYSPRLAPWLRANATRFDAAIVHGIWLYPSYGAWRVLRRTGTPYFVYTHGLLDPSLRRVFPLKHLAKSVAWLLREYRVARDARAVFFTCEEERLLAERNFRPYRCRPRIVPYCVGSPPGDPKAQREMFLLQYPECRDRRLILFLSRIHVKKGCDLLLRAFAEAAARDPALRLVMAGPDPLRWREQLEHEAEQLSVAERITWTGMLSGDLKWGAFRAAEVFALPSHQENFGIAVVEALACGVPVLITRKVNIWREIEADGAGRVEDDTLDGAKALLRAWLNTPAQEREAMKARALACFGKRYRSEEAGRTLLEALRAGGAGERKR